MYPPTTSSPLGHHHLTAQILNYQLTHGMHLRHIHLKQPQPSHNTTSSSSSYPISTSIFPTPFPRALFHHAHNLQPIYNELYARLSDNESWLYNSVIAPLLPVDSFARILWEIHLRMKNKRGGGGGGYGSDISMGLFRSDYMLHVPGEYNEEVEVEVGVSLEENDNAGLRLKQVEFNTIACAGGCHAKKVVDMHRYLTRTGVYNDDGSLSSAANGEGYREKSPITLSSLPTNENIKGLADSLATAHDIYYGGPVRSDLATKTGVLFVVQPDNFNVADELPIEYALWDRENPIPTYRVEWGDDVLERTCLGGNRELLFYPHLQGEGSRPVEISVVYLRAGLEVHEYDAVGIECRVRLEQSRAIKCPSVLGHVLTFKKVQQALMGPGVLERFLDSKEKVSAIRDTFVGMFSMDGDSEEGRYARGLATDPESAWRYILKPSLEGGGHNIYGEDIPGFLLGMSSESEWGRYVLMERIRSPVVGNVLMSRMGVEESDVVSELGVFGLCIWKKGEILRNKTVGWSLKTKFADVDEMSVVKGFGCFDTPLLV
ncbi:glutathione synthetase [Aspergillus luchuensis]|uniref:Glutathione synthetase n=1 Tax=Aspergillus kawachii TaxID=1069201 RepID=A0A146FBT1_ASPKA|nr:uncharacterized protein AKAW2_10273S [Aspergillus luchuensis]BCR93227.1 hypothetical protein AKAW2_10273S [Aspergillus luchuensis]GAA86776.1 glutathione synthetase [Aspergillus luchuensis IFO 4308]GAT23109.1 glutathione synthetase [Aspergillus luchuensis]